MVILGLHNSVYVNVFRISSQLWCVQSWSICGGLREAVEKIRSCHFSSPPHQSSGARSGPVGILSHGSGYPACPPACSYGRPSRRPWLWYPTRSTMLPTVQTGGWKSCMLLCTHKTYLIIYLWAIYTRGGYSDVMIQNYHLMIFGPQYNSLQLESRWHVTHRSICSHLGERWCKRKMSSFLDFKQCY